ncbi:uncharacterized protein [Paramisgurnus dabryanus]|uniref:uncharacterized protein n=1 Tax=Paramisgurnus dabryanus TaxID=90735 RepID=UPI003CCFD020
MDRSQGIKQTAASGFWRSKQDYLSHSEMSPNQLDFVGMEWPFARKQKGWKEYQSSLYFISSEKKSWSESRRYCRERGADLIIINNGEEEDFIDEISVEDKHWIGLSDSEVEGRWKWVDGSTLSYSVNEQNQRAKKSTEILVVDRMKMEMIYENVADYRTQTGVNTNRQQPLQSTGSERVRMRSYRSVSVCLVLLCVLLLTAVIVLCVLINTNNQQFNIKNKNITEEREQLLTKYTNITEERDQLLTKYTNITEERDQLLTKYTITDGWIQYRFSLYFISSKKKSWTESRRYCTQKGADLLIINNKEEQDFVQKISSTNHIWIGLSDSDKEGRWKWVDGSTLTSGFWSPKEPNGGRGENCAESYSSKWNDLPCNHARKWICKKNLK